VQIFEFIIASKFNSTFFRFNVPSP